MFSVRCELSMNRNVFSANVVFVCVSHETGRKCAAGLKGGVLYARKAWRLP